MFGVTMLQKAVTPWDREEKPGKIPRDNIKYNKHKG
jgi:hypothetical protein